LARQEWKKKGRILMDHILFLSIVLAVVVFLMVWNLYDS
jgi:hypothetical protein